MKKYMTDKKEDYNNHWAYCIQNDFPFIRIIPKIKYSKVEYDISTMTDLYKMEKEPSEFFVQLYESYVEFFKLPKDKMCCAGGESSLIFTVHKAHATIFAEQLFDYLIDYVKKNRKSLLK